MAKKRLLVLGNSYMDFSANVRRAPERGECVVSNGDHSLFPGGFGAITAITAARLGSDTVFCARIGDDEYGEKLKKAFSLEGVDQRFIVTDRRKPTGVRAITIEENHKTRMITYQGANNSICFDDIEASFTSYPDLFLLNLKMREDIIVDAVKFASYSGVPVMIFCGDEAKEFDIENIVGIEVIVTTKEQARRITGIDPVDANSALHSCVKIANKIKSKYVVLQLGERGTFVFDGVYSEIISKLDVQRIDPSGENMIFSAALAHSYLEHGDIKKASVFANAASSFSVSTEGVYQSVPSMADIKKMLDNR